MEPSSIAEQRATAVARLKRAASLPRMKDGRRPPMHVEAVSEGERVDVMDKPEEESAQDSDERPETQDAMDSEVAQIDEHLPTPEQEPEFVAQPAVDTQEREEKAEDTQQQEGSSERPSTPGRKRRSRSRARSRGSKDLRSKAKTPPLTSNESSDERGDEDVPPSPPVVSPTPHFANLQASRFLRSPISPGTGMLYPGTTPSTPMLPSLDDIQKGMGLFRSNSVGAARMMAMQKLVGGSEPMDVTLGGASPTPLGRNNTVSGGERIAARTRLLARLGERVEKAEVEKASDAEEMITVSRPVTPATSKRRRRRSRRSSSRASAVLDDRDERDREATSTSPNTPVVPSSPLPQLFNHSNDPPLILPQISRTPVQQHNGFEPDVSQPMGGRGVVIEDEDEEAERRPTQPYGLPATPSRRLGARLPHTSDAPSNASTDSAPMGIAVPFYLSSHPGAYKQNAFPDSPFATPLRERPFADEEEESDAYAELQQRAPSRSAFPRDSEISWVAEPVPLRMPIRDDDDEEDEEDGDEEDVEQSEVTQQSTVAQHDDHDDAPAQPTDDQSSHPYYPMSPDTSTASASKELVIEDETSPELSSSHIPPSPSSVAALNVPLVSQTPVSARPSPPVYPMRLSVATPIPQSERSPSTTDFPVWEDSRNESTPKRGTDVVAGAWDRFKNALTRSNSSSGRRSRTNSIGTRDRRYNTDSSVSRESGVSQTSARVDKVEQSSVVQSPVSLGQSPSASASILSLAQGVPHTPMSPVPPASSADLMKYADSKLFPFPGMIQLEEKRNKAKGITSASSPDIVLAPNGIEAVHSTSSSSSATTKSPPVIRERKLSHQASDSRLLPKFTSLNSISPISNVPSSGSHADYFSLHSATSTGSVSSGLMKLPTNVEGVRKWLGARKLFSSQNSTPTTPSAPAVLSLSDTKPRTPLKKPSLSDLLSTSRKDNDLSDWEDIGNEKFRTPTSTTSTSGPGKNPFGDEPKPIEVRVDITASTTQSPFLQHAQQPRDVTATTHVITEFSPLSSPPEPPSSTTPDPQSSLDDYPALSTSDSQSSSLGSPEMPSHDTRKAAIIMSRLDEVLGRNSKGSILSVSLEDPPRKLILSSPVLQVSNANIVKDRFLFLFSDILIIAKPILADQDALLDAAKPTPMDRKFAVKSVVLLRDLKITADRDESRSKVALYASHARHPVIRSFVHQFAKDPDQAITTLFEKSVCRDDPIALGQLLFRIIDLDRMRLGEYLSRRASKVVLKAYIDSFGFTGMRIDKALRVFLLSVCIPPKASLDYLLDTFAGRWFEANVGIVAYDKDLAIRLVRAIVQLNEVMHGGIAHTTGLTGYPKRNVISRDFVDAFRRSDARGLVSDDLLDKIYAAIRRERLSQARKPSSDTDDADIMISIKRPLPARLTFRIQSEPVVLRIPQTDPHLTIQLFGQDLVFEPSELSFAKSPEASFRVTGTSLGQKTVIMRRCGANALAYSGLPFSSPIVVERSFMRNTFQLAFLNHHGAKRKYMFSLNDALIRHQWVVQLKQQIDLMSAPRATVIEPSGSSLSLKAKKAVEALALKALQETVISPEDDTSLGGLFPSAVDRALARLTGVSTIRTATPNGSLSQSNPLNGNRRSRGDIYHTRSKSRSQIYHVHGAGKMEPDVTDDGDASDDGLLRRDVSMSQRSDERTWSGHDLEVVCRQNSLIPAVLGHLYVDLDNETIIS